MMVVSATITDAEHLRCSRSFTRQGKHGCTITDWLTEVGWFICGSMVSATLALRVYITHNKNRKMGIILLIGLLLQLALGVKVPAQGINWDTVINGYCAAYHEEAVEHQYHINLNTWLSWSVVYDVIMIIASCTKLIRGAGGFKCLRKTSKLLFTHCIHYLITISALNLAQLILNNFTNAPNLMLINVAVQIVLGMQQLVSEQDLVHGYSFASYAQRVTQETGISPISVDDRPGNTQSGSKGSWSRRMTARLGRRSHDRTAAADASANDQNDIHGHSTGLTEKGSPSEVYDQSTYNARRGGAAQGDVAHRAIDVEQDAARSPYSAVASSSSKGSFTSAGGVEKYGLLTAAEVFPRLSKHSSITPGNSAGGMSPLKKDDESEILMDDQMTAVSPGGSGQGYLSPSGGGSPSVQPRRRDKNNEDGDASSTHGLEWMANSIDMGSRPLPADSDGKPRSRGTSVTSSTKEGGSK